MQLLTFCFDLPNLQMTSSKVNTMRVTIMIIANADVINETITVDKLED